MMFEIYVLKELNGRIKFADVSGMIDPLTDSLTFNNVS